MFTKAKTILIVMLTSIISGLSCQALAEQPAQKSVLNIQSWQTKNGARVLFVAAPEVPMLQINLVFAAGSAQDGNKPGLAQFTANMLDQGTEKLSADQIAANFDNVGAGFGATVNRDKTIVSFQTLTEPNYLQPGLNNFIQLLKAPSFPQDAFKRTQQQTLVALQQRQQTPDLLAINAFYAAAFANSPYSHPVLGEESSIKAITPEDLRNFYHQYYVGKNALVTLVGAVSRAQAEQIAEQVVGELPAGAAVMPIPSINVGQSNLKKIEFPSTQSQIFVGQVGIDLQNPHYFPLVVGNYIFGGAPLTSRLYKEVRETRGLAYSVQSLFLPLIGNGPFLIVLQTRNQEAERALQIVNESLDKFIKQGPTEQELAEAKKKIINGFPLTLASNDDISAQLIRIGFYHLPLNYLDTVRAKINAVTREQVMAAWQQVVQPKRLTTIILGDLNTATEKTQHGPTTASH